MIQKDKLIDLLLLSEKDEIDMIVDNNRIIIENLVIYVEMNLTNLSFCIIEAFSYFGITLNYNYENKKFLICKGAIPSSPTNIPSDLQQIGGQQILFDVVTSRPKSVVKDRDSDSDDSREQSVSIENQLLFGRGRGNYLNLHQIFYLIKKNNAINISIICDSSYVEVIQFCNVGEMWKLKTYNDPDRIKNTNTYTNNFPGVKMQNLRNNINYTNTQIFFLNTRITNFIISECLKHDFHYHMQVEDALNKLNSKPYKRYIHVLSR